MRILHDKYGTGSVIALSTLIPGWYLVLFDKPAFSKIRRLSIPPAHCEILSDDEIGEESESDAS